MNFDAVGVSLRDLTAGLDYIKGIASQSKFAWLSANLVNKADRQLIFAPSITLSRADLNISILGLTGSRTINLLADKDKIDILAWQEVLPNLMTKLATTSDLIVLLSSLPDADNNAIAQQYDKINIIIQADTGSNNKQPTLTNNSLACQVTNRGKYLGIMQINWGGTKRWQMEDKTKLLQSKNSTLDRINWQLNRYNIQGDPEEALRQEPDKLNTYRNMAQQQEMLTREIEGLRQDIQLESETGKAPATFTNQFIAMETSLPDQPEVLQVVEKTKEKVNRLGLNKTAVNAPEPNPQAGGGNDAEFPYAGWAACAACHQDQVASWQKTAHFAAYLDLAKKKQQFNLDCLYCHVTGVESGDDPRALTLQVDLQAVGCEVCHGPGRQHIAAPAEHRLIKKPAEGLCRRCHTPEQDDNFDYNAKLKLLGCPTAN